MNNIFEISGDEIKRILSLHEESTKQQYLNVLNEQRHISSAEGPKHKINGNITLKNVNLLDRKLTLFSGFKFIGGYGDFVIGVGKYQLLDKTYDGEIKFNCSTRKFSTYESGMGSGNEFWYDDTKVLSGKLSPLCVTLSELSNYHVKSINGLEFSDKNGNNTYSITPNNYIEYFTKTSKARVLSSAKNSYITFTCPNNFNAEYLTKNKEVIKIIPKNKETLSFFQKSFCNTKQKSNQSKTQQPQLTDQQKLDKAKKCGYNSWDEYKNNNWVCKTQTTQQKPVTKQTPQQFAQQVTNYNKTIQTSLGSQKPTGQITDADLDNILTKLG